MKKSIFIGMIVVLAATLAMGLVTLHAGQTDFGVTGQGPGWGPEYVPQQDGGAYTPNDRGPRGYREKAINLIERGWGMVSGMRGGGWGMGSGMRGGDWGMGSGMRGGGWGMGSGMRGGSWGMGSGMRGGSWGMGSGMRGGGWGMGSGMRGGGCR